MTKLILAAALLVSTAAHARPLERTAKLDDIVASRPIERTAKLDDIVAPRPIELRTQPVPHNAKSDRTLGRAAARTPVESATSAARGLEIDDVLTKVNGVYMAGLQRCYRKSLAIDPSVSGKLDIAFKVTADGKVTSALSGDGIEVCLTNLMASWRFGVALDDGGVPTDASFKISLVLR